MTSRRSRPPLNGFGIAFGLTGLAATWSESTSLLQTPQFIADSLWALAMGAWVTTLLLYITRLEGLRELGQDLRHPVLGPFAALIPIPPMLLGAHLFSMSQLVSKIVVGACVIVLAIFAFWYLSQLMTVSRGFAAVHSGYFLPTVAGGLLSAQSFAYIGQKSLAVGAFGIGILFWLLIGGALLARTIAGPDSWIRFFNIGNLLGPTGRCRQCLVGYQ